MKPTYLFTLLLPLSFYSCGDNDHFYQLSWSLGFGNFMATTPVYEQKNCQNSFDNWPSSPITEVVLNITDIEDKVRPISRSYSCEEGLAPDFITLAGFGKQKWIVELLAKRADGVVLYSYPPTITDFSQPLTEPLPMHSLTGNLNFSLCFGSCNQLSCPTDITSWEVDFYKEEADGSFANIASQHLQNNCTGYAEVKVVELNAESVHDQAIPLYKIVAKGLDSQGNILYCGSNTRPVKASTDNLRDNVILNIGACE